MSTAKRPVERLQTSVELLQGHSGPALAASEGWAARDEATARIRRGEFAEALVWIERSSEAFEGLVRLYERSA